MTEKKIREWVQNTQWINLVALCILCLSIYGFGLFWRDITREFNPHPSLIMGLINSFSIGCAGSFIFLLITLIKESGLSIIKDNQSIPEKVFTFFIVIANILLWFIALLYFKGSWINFALDFFGSTYQFNIQNSLINTPTNKFLLFAGGIFGLVTNEYYHILFGSGGFLSKGFKFLSKIFKFLSKCLNHNEKQINQ